MSPPHAYTCTTPSLKKFVTNLGPECPPTPPNEHCFEGPPPPPPHRYTHIHSSGPPTPSTLKLDEEQHTPYSKQGSAKPSVRWLSRWRSPQTMPDLSALRKHYPVIDEDIRAITQLFEAHSQKKYMSGFLNRRTGYMADGRPCRYAEWEGCYAELSGSVLTIWDVCDVTDASQFMPPKYINIADATAQILASNFIDSRQNIFTLNTAGVNQYLFEGPDAASVNQWVCAIRLSCFEGARLHELYTGAIVLRQPSSGKRTPADKPTKFTGYLQVRFAGSTEWQRYWVVVPDRGKDVWQKETQCLFYAHKGDKLPAVKMVRVYQAYAIFPEKADLIERCSIHKVEGSLVSSKSPFAKPGPPTYALLMADTSIEMVKSLTAFRNAFRLQDSHVAPHKDRLFLDLKNVEHVPMVNETLASTKQIFSAILEQHDVEGRRPSLTFSEHSANHIPFGSMGMKSTCKTPLRILRRIFGPSPRMFFDEVEFVDAMVERDGCGMEENFRNLTLGSAVNALESHPLKPLPDIPPSLGANATEPLTNADARSIESRPPKIELDMPFESEVTREENTEETPPLKRLNLRRLCRAARILDMTPEEMVGVTDVDTEAEMEIPKEPLPTLPMIEEEESEEESSTSEDENSDATVETVNPPPKIDVLPEDLGRFDVSISLPPSVPTTPVLQARKDKPKLLPIPSDSDTTDVENGQKISDSEDDKCLAQLRASFRSTAKSSAGSLGPGSARGNLRKKRSGYSSSSISLIEPMPHPSGRVRARRVSDESLDRWRERSLESSRRSGKHHEARPSSGGPPRNLRRMRHGSMWDSEERSARRMSVSTEQGGRASKPPEPRRGGQSRHGGASANGAEKRYHDRRKSGGDSGAGGRSVKHHQKRSETISYSNNIGNNGTGEVLNGNSAVSLQPSQIQPQPMQNQPMQNQPMQGQPMQGATMMQGPMPMVAMVPATYGGFGMFTSAQPIFTPQAFNPGVNAMPISMNNGYGGM
ncbi:uncharacterized protein VTP21DRAFT_1244 [Calcarisporiella thermophila]|uniref:uncharacterized protein n=1 Tax=Calcarisporiella thermophila TaxID=911321 RepID=UPI003742C390